MENTLRLPRRKVFSLESLRRLTRLINVLALAGCLGVVAFVALRFFAEWMYPAAPVAQEFFGSDDGHHAVYLINPALRWIGCILLVSSNAQIVTGIVFGWRDKPCMWKLLGGTAVFLVAYLFLAASYLSCGC